MGFICYIGMFISLKLALESQILKIWIEIMISFSSRIFILGGGGSFILFAMGKLCMVMSCA